MQGAHTRVVSCPLCGQQFFPQSLPFHKKQCEKKLAARRVQCPYCDQEVAQLELPRHVSRCHSVSATRRRGKPSRRPASRQTGPRTAWDDDFSGPLRFPPEALEDGRVRCVHCGRFFSADRIHEHQAICGSLKSARPRGVDGEPTQWGSKVFNSEAQRSGSGPLFLSAEEHEQRQQRQQRQQPQHKGRSSPQRARRSQTSWREKHAEFVAACRAARARLEPAPPAASAEDDQVGLPQPMRVTVSYRPKPLTRPDAPGRRPPLARPASAPAPGAAPMDPPAPPPHRAPWPDDAEGGLGAAAAGLLGDQVPLRPRPARPSPAPAPFAVLREMYASCRRAPEAFRAEYAASTQYLLALIEDADEAGLEAPGARGGRGAGENALHFAAGCGCIEACGGLLRRCVRLNFQQDDRGQTPLLWAVEHGMLRTAELLLRSSADAEHADARGRTALHLASAHGYARVCQLLLALPGVRAAVDRRSDCGWTALHQASFAGWAAACRALLEQGGADARATTPAEAWTPLHLAAMQGHAEVVECLAPLEQAAPPARDGHGCSALDLARLGGHAEAASLLREPEEAHRQLTRKWSRLFQSADPERQLPDAPSPPLQILPPQVHRVSEGALELLCDITDLEYRLIEYVLEVRRCDGPYGAAPARVYYARVGEQRKVDRVRFEVPRVRQSGGPALWEAQGEYQFRLVGRCERCPQLPLPVAPWQVVSEWSPPTVLRCSRREHSRTRRPRARARSLCRARVRGACRGSSYERACGIEPC